MPTPIIFLNMKKSGLPVLEPARLQSTALWMAQLQEQKAKRTNRERIMTTLAALGLFACGILCLWGRASLALWLLFGTAWAVCAFFDSAVSKKRALTVLEMDASGRSIGVLVELWPRLDCSMRTLAVSKIALLLPQLQPDDTVWLFQRSGVSLVLPYIELLAQGKAQLPGEESLQAAAQLCLPLLRTWAQHEQARLHLLRTSSAPDTSTGRLLRPSMDKPHWEGEQLLRANLSLRNTVGLNSVRTHTPAGAAPDRQRQDRR